VNNGSKPFSVTRQGKGGAISNKKRKGSACEKCLCLTRGQASQRRNGYKSKPPRKVRGGPAHKIRTRTGRNTSRHDGTVLSLKRIPGSGEARFHSSPKKPCRTHPRPCRRVGRKRAGRRRPTSWWGRLAVGAPVKKNRPKKRNHGQWDRRKAKANPVAGAEKGGVRPQKSSFP